MAELKLKQLLSYHRISQRALGAGVGLSASTVNLIINNNIWPRSPTRNELMYMISEFLTQRGITDLQLVSIFETDDTFTRLRPENPQPDASTKAL